MRSLNWLLIVIIAACGRNAYCDNELENEFVRVVGDREEIPELSLHVVCNVNQQEDYDLWMDGGFVLEKSKVGGKEVVLAANEIYSFGLSKLGSEFSVFHLERRAGEKAEQTSKRVAESYPVKFMLAGRSLAGIPLSRLVKSGQFKLVSAQAVDDDVPNLVRVEFSCGPEEYEDGFTFEIVRAELTCDRNLNWFVLESRVETVEGDLKTPTTYTETILPGPTQNGVVLVQSYQQAMFVSGKSWPNDATLEYDLQPPDRRQFYLTYYCQWAPQRIPTKGASKGTNLVH